MTCGPCQDLLLDYLYGLLDPAETDNLRSHLDDCPECRAALGRVTLEKTRIAKAARAISHVPEFHAPDHRPTEPTPLPVPLAEVSPSRRSGYRPLAWILASALAASVLVVGFFGYRLNERIGEQSARVAGLDRKIQQSTFAIAAHDTDTLRRRVELPEMLGRKVVQMTVAGANRVVPGVTAPLTISLSDLDGQPHRGAVDVEVLDAQNKTIATRHLAIDKSATVSAAELAANHVGPAKVVVRFAEADGAPAVIEERLRLMPKSYASHLSVNKQLYRPGEAVQVRALFVNPWTLKIADGPLQPSVSLTDETGPKVTQTLAFVKGMAAASMQLPPNLPPGVYTVRLNAEELAPASRTIEVLAPDQPAADVVAQGQAYHPGDTAHVPVQVYQADGSPAANADVKGNYRVQNSLEQRNFNYGNGVQFQNRSQGFGGIANGFNSAQNSAFNNTFVGPINQKTDANGQIILPVEVPKELETKNLRLSLDMQVKKRKIEASASLRVVPSKLAVDFHPEGGRLVAGVANRVYYRVRTPLGETVAPEGRVILMSSTAVIHDSEREQSAGVFDFVPDPKEKYQLRITAPMQGQVDDPFASLGIRPDGVLLLGDGVQPGDRPIRLDVENVGRSRSLQVITTCRGEIVEYQRFRQEEGVFDGPSAVRNVDKLDDKIRARGEEQPSRKDVGGRRIEIPSKFDGIHRVAVFELKGGDMTLLAERLIYRQPAHRLDVSAKLSNKTGNHVQFHVDGKDEAGHPAEFFGLASVVDDRFVDDQPEPTLTEQFLILGDPTAEIVDQPLLVNPAGLDLALGVLGWQAAPPPEPAQVAKADADRRDEAKRRAEGRPEAQLGAKAGRNRSVEAVDGKRAGEATTTFFSRVQPSPNELRQRLTALAAVARGDLDQQASKQGQALLDERNAVVRERDVAQAELRELEEQPHQWAMMGLGAVTLGALVIGTLALLWGFARMLRGGSASASFGIAFAGIAGCLLLLLLRPQNDITQPIGVAERKPQAAPKAALPEDMARGEGVMPHRGSIPATAYDLRADLGDRPVLERLAEAGPVVPLAGGLGGGGGLGKRQLGEFDALYARGAAKSMRDAPTAPLSKKATFELKMQKDSGAKQMPGQLPGQPPGGFGAAVPAPAPDKAMKGAQGKEMTALPTKPATAPASLPAQPVAPMASAKSTPAGPSAPPGVPNAPTHEKEAIERFLERAGANMGVDTDRIHAEFGMKRSIDVATLLWNPALYVPSAGATLSFDVPVGAARYRIFLLGHTNDGRLGSFEDRLVVTPASPRPAP